MITKRNRIFSRVAWVGLATALLVAAPLSSAQEEKQQFQLTEKVGEALQKLKPLQDSKNFAGMMEVVDAQLKTVPPTSYDASYLLDLKARIYLQLDQFNNAIAPWEQAVKLDEQFGYKEEKERLEVIKILAQLIFSQASDLKDKARQRELVERSASYLKRYLDKAPKPESDVQMLYSQILFFQATADPQNVNAEMLNEAGRVVEKAMLGTIRPKEGFYLLQLAILQQQNNFARAADIMELLLRQYPNKKDIWPMLFGTYVNLAGSAKPESKEQRELYVRAINTIERAQALGFMTTPRDHYNLFTLYLSAGAINIATDMLHAGMKSGKIESNLANWRVLGSYLQQSNRELQAISALQEATKLFPKEGSLDFMTAQIYQQLEQTKEVYNYCVRAVNKGNLGEKPHQVHLLLAYSAYELDKLDEALKAINEAGKTPEGAKDSQVKSLKDAITAMIAEREAAREAIKKEANKI